MLLVASKLVTVWVLWVYACQAPDYQLCTILESYDQRDGLSCQFNRLVADHYHQKEFDPVDAVTFSRCQREEQIIIDNRPEPPGQRGRD